MQIIQNKQVISLDKRISWRSLVQISAGASVGTLAGISVGTPAAVVVAGIVVEVVVVAGAEVPLSAVVVTGADALAMSSSSSLCNHFSTNLECALKFMVASKPSLVDKKNHLHKNLHQWLKPDPPDNPMLVNDKGNASNRDKAQHPFPNTVSFYGLLIHIAEDRILIYQNQFHTRRRGLSHGIPSTSLFQQTISASPQDRG